MVAVWTAVQAAMQRRLRSGPLTARSTLAWIAGSSIAAVAAWTGSIPLSWASRATGSAAVKTVAWRRGVVTG